VRQRTSVPQILLSPFRKPTFIHFGHKQREQTLTFLLHSLREKPYKIFAIILNQRLVDNIESELGDYQSGFSPNRSTIIQYFQVRQIIEKSYEYNIDYTQAFDSTK
jgi:hypothetical protein